MFIDKYIIRVYDILSSYSDDFDTIMAYPYRYNHTRLERPCVTVSSAGEEISNVGIGYFGRSANVMIKVSVYIPLKMGVSALADVIDTIAKSGVFDDSVSCKTGGVDSNKTLDTLCQSIVIEYEDFLENCDE